MSKPKTTNCIPAPLPFAGLRFAVYCRKSKDDDARSVARQLAQSRDYVARNDGVLLDDHIYTDEDTSGAEFQIRPGLLRLLNALGPGCPFSAVVLMDDDRLGREPYRMYGCMHAAKRGSCVNRFYQRVDLVEEAFLATLQREVLTPEHLATAVQYSLARLRAHLTQEPDPRPALARECQALTRRIERMVTAIGDGRGAATLVAEIAKAEEQIKALEIELARLAAIPQRSSQ